ncbi:MAG TPA: pyridoxal 5'-phosphate synthase glutaminase subunit PdxT [Ilumatobacteraceae bacterium]|nr:pyridoxal 5'-phosphate synthase glutaminase subunit PdxT [Ilumatobacteraceae bacterium]HAN36309.1 pyridoxal 5'-phosphate synthase glutaminase subunit PdxT [Acidimicrobiaceae bacterium]MBP9052803.1 pyridoxal 5'-phosphate synthase glutaminase subunit PdxT [Ilumatobacteraceae bacterium]HQY16432.1 pyridoxal 5'-phosphate synthase glutaminase subunit PdxT [Ilumatobacteraceae bacterium]HRA83205.1 pyridoxal 5'-phosphate synthase glutaminase subunit PdxT [Ilumatobacteraceae bacterium]
MNAAQPAPCIGVLALQGAFTAHEDALRSLHVTTRQVRTPADLTQVAALVMPGGESTTMARLLETSQMFDELSARISAGMPVFGTCAGMILLAKEVLDGRTDQRSFGAIDIGVRRNGYGRQVDSFETDVEVSGLDRPFHAVFIRAPKVVTTGTAVEVLATHDGVPVLARQGHIMVASFHPEITADARLHQMFLQHNGFTTEHRSTSTERG